MNFRSTIIGIVASTILLVVLGLARLFTVTAAVPDLKIREIETINIEPPPPPLIPQEEITPEELTPPPALTDLSPLPDPTRVPIPQAKVPVDLTTPVENFFTDLAPAALPTITKKIPTPSTARPKTKIPPATKSHFNTSELDSTPRLLRHGSANFPATLASKGVKRGTVTFQVELSASGSITILKVISSTHSELISAARKIASSARFTPPTRNGKAVKAVMQWPIVIKK